MTPLASVEELAARWPDDGCIMLADEAEMLATCMGAMRDSGVCLPVICYSKRPSPETIFAALHKEACGYVELPLKQSALRSTIDSAYALFKSTRAGRVRKQQAGALMIRLSPREREVLGHAMLGMCGKASARELSISPRTVELHRANVLAKLGASSLLAASVIAMDADGRPDIADAKAMLKSFA